MNKTKISDVLVIECLSGIELSIEILAITIIWIFGNWIVALILLCISLYGSIRKIMKIADITK